MMSDIVRGSYLHLHCIKSKLTVLSEQELAIRTSFGSLFCSTRTLLETGRTADAVRVLEEVETTVAATLDAIAEMREIQLQNIDGLELLLEAIGQGDCEESDGQDPSAVIAREIQYLDPDMARDSEAPPE